jgi:hypothetical protein
LLVARPVEIATYVLASAIAIGGGYIGAEVIFGGEPPQARPAPERGAPDRSTTVAAAPAEGAELRNGRYGFSFRHPQGWQSTPVNQQNVVAAVARPDGVLCMVTVNELRLPSDASGKPEQLSRMLAGFNPSHITQAVPGAGAKVSAFEKSTLGGQEARRFVLEASLPPLGALKISGHATLRGFGAIVLMCMAPERLLGASDVKAAFALVHKSFRFE